MIGLSLLSTSHPLSFQPKWVRPSTGSYPRFSLLMDSSPWLRVYGMRLTRPIQTRFRCGSLFSLTLPHAVTRWLILQKARRHRQKSAPTACRQTVSGTISLPARGCFSPFPHRYWFTIGHKRVFRIGGWTPQVPTGFHVSGSTQVPLGSLRRFAYGAFTLSRQLFQAILLPRSFVTPQ